MRITELDKLQVGDKFFYQEEEAVVTAKRPKEHHLSLGSEVEDKSLHFTFKVGDKNITLVSRLDAKGTTFENRGGVQTEVFIGLDLADYQLTA